MLDANAVNERRRSDGKRVVVVLRCMLKVTNMGLDNWWLLK